MPIRDLVYLALVDKPSSVPKNDLDQATLQNVLNVVFALAGAVAVAFVVWGGIKYILSRGEPAEINKARDTILYAVIGLVVVITSYGLLNYVIGKF